MKKTIFILLIIASCLINFSCDLNSGCGGPPSDSWATPGVSIYGLSENNILYNDSFTYRLLTPIVYYTFKSKDKLPLLINYESMTFEVLKQNIVIDSMIINYKMKPVYYAEDKCRNARYLPFVTIENFYSTGHYFKILGYFSINDW